MRRRWSLLGLLEGRVGRKSTDPMPTECVFCAIVAGDTAADLVLDDDDFVAFLDRRPVFKGHVLLVPREHVVDAARPAGRRCVTAFLAAAQRLAAAVVDGARRPGLVRGDEQHGQPVGAAPALHVVPRTKGDGLRGFFWPRTKYARPTSEAEYAARLRAALE